MSVVSLAGCMQECSERKQRQIVVHTYNPVILEPVAQKASFTFCNGIKLPLVIIVHGKVISTSSLVGNTAISDGGEQGFGQLMWGLEFRFTGALGKMNFNTVSPSCTSKTPFNRGSDSDCCSVLRKS